MMNEEGNKYSLVWSMANKGAVGCLAMRMFASKIVGYVDLDSVFRQWDCFGTRFGGQSCESVVWGCLRMEGGGDCFQTDAEVWWE